MGDFPRPHGPVLHSEPIAVLEDGTEVKRRIPRMRACDRKDAKGKLCTGHLKRYHDGALQGRFGEELYRCERCRTIYLPNPAETPRTRTLSW